MTGQEPRLSQLELHYRKAVQDQLDLLIWPGMAPGGGELHLSLEEGHMGMVAAFHVKPELPAALSLNERQLLEQARRRGGLDSEQSLHLSALRSQRWRQDMLKAWTFSSSSAENLEEEDTPVQVILGDTGQGKSTMLRMAAVRQARRSPTPEGKLPLLPLYLPLDAHEGLLEEEELPRLLAAWWERRCQLPGLEALFRHALEEQRALVLLDGLDTLHEPQARERFIPRLESWVARWAGRGNCFMLTCRSINHDTLRLPGAWQRTVLVGFPSGAVKQLALIAYEEQEAGARAETEAQALVEELGHAPRAAMLATCPQALLRLVLLRRELGSLPSRVTEFYEAYVRHVLRGHEALLPYLKELALWLRQHRPSGLARGQEVERGLGVQGPDREPWERLVAEGCLVMDHGQGLLSFVLPELRDFLAAKALADRSAEERWRLLAPCLHDPRWRETLLLCAGLLVDRGASDVGELVGRILSAGSELEPLLHRDVLLAADVCMALSGRLPAVTLDALAGHLEGLLEDGIRRVRRRALAGLDALSALGNERAQRCLQTCLEQLREESDLWERWGRAPFPTSPPARQLREWLDSQRSPAWELLKGEPLRPAPPSEHDFNQYLNDRRYRRQEIAELNSPEYRAPNRAVEKLRPWITRDEEVRQAMLAALERGDYWLREKILQVLVAEAPEDMEVRGVLLRHLERSRGHGSPLLAQTLQAEVASSRQLRDFFLQRMKEAPGSLVPGFAARVLAGQAGVDPEVRSALLARLATPDSWVRGTTIENLTTALGNEQVRQAVLTCLEADEDAFVRSAAAEALGGDAEREPRILQALLTRLNTLPEEEQECVYAIKAMEPASAVPWVARALQKKLESTRRRESEAAATALSPAVGRNPELRQRMLEWLSDASPSRREAAILVLGGCVKKDEEARQAIRARLEDAEPRVRLAVVLTLGAWAGADEALRRVLLERLEAPDSTERSAVLSSMREAIAGCEPLRQAALARLADESAPVRRAAIEVLAPLVAEDDEVYRHIRALWTDAAPEVTCEVVAAVALRLEREPTLAEQLLTWLGASGTRFFQNQRIYEALVPRLAALAARDAAVLERVTQELRSPEWAWRQGAVLVLLTLPGGLPAAWRPALMALLEDLGDADSGISETLLNPREVAGAFLGADDVELRERGLAYVLAALERVQHPWHRSDREDREGALMSTLSKHWHPLHRDERVLRHVLRFLQRPASVDGTRDTGFEPNLEYAYRVLLRLVSAPA